MDRLLPTVVIVALVVAVGALMLMGWRARRRRQAHLAAPLAVPTGLPAASLMVDGWYVATTLANLPLERIAVHGLGFRARASIAVHREGVVCDRRGSLPLYVPAVSLRSAGRATWAIDRVVEPDGLLVMGWMLGSTSVDTYFRIPDRDDADRLRAAIRALLPAPDPVEDVVS